MRGRLVGWVWIVGLACGPESGDGGAIGSAATTADHASSTDVTTGISTSTSTSTTTTGEGTSGTTSVPDDPSEYAVFYVVGGYDRIFVRKADAERDLCITVIFVEDDLDVPPSVSLPELWELEGAGLHQGAAGCLEVLEFPPDTVSAEGVTGASSWEPVWCPQALDIEVTLMFTPGVPWVPAMEVLHAVELPVKGC